MGKEGMLVVAALMTISALAFLLFLFPYVRLWTQALAAHTRLSILDIVRFRLKRCPPELLVHAMISLTQRGVKVTAQEVEGCYLAAVVRGEPVETAAELANLIEDVKRNAPDAPRP